MANFDELLPKIQTWDVEEEEILINKIKQMTEDYQQKCSDLSINLNNMTRNLHLIEVDFFNTLNGLKEISGKKFIEHVIDTEDIKPMQEDEEKKDLPEESDLNFSSVNSIIQRGLDFIAFRDQQKSQNKNNVEDDTVSMNSKVMDNNLMKNNRGLKLPLLIGTKDFNDNDYIGLVLDDEEEEENFDNELRNDQGVIVPKESGAQGEEVLTDLNNNNLSNPNNLNNNPEEFHNMVQQQMGKPIVSQNMFESENEVKNEMINPAMQVESNPVNINNNNNEGGLGGLLRNSNTILQPQLPNMINNSQMMNNNMPINNNMNMMSKTTNITDVKKPPIGGGKFSLSNFLGNDMFGDDDDDDDTGLFGRPKKNMNMTQINKNSNNMQLNNNQNMVNNNAMMPGANIQMQNNNMNNAMQFNNEQNEQPQTTIPLNQRMEMVPNPLLLMKQQQQQQQNLNPQIQPQIEEKKENIVENKMEENDDDNLNDFQKRRKNLANFLNPNNQRMMNPMMKPPMMNPMINNENIVQNEMPNKESEINANLNNENINNLNQNLESQFNNNQNVQNVKPIISQRELENKRKLENAKSKINFIFGDDDDDDDDIFSRKKPLNKAENIEEKSQNLNERLNQITASYSTNINNNMSKKMNDLFSNEPSNTNANNLFQSNNSTNINNNQFSNNQFNNSQVNNNNLNANKPSIKKKAFFLDEDDDEDFNLKLPNKNINNQNINQKPEINLNNQNMNINMNNQNMNNMSNTQPMVKNEPKIIMPKPMNQPLNIPQEIQNKPEPKIIMPQPVVKKTSIFEEEEKPKIEAKIEPKIIMPKQIENQPPKIETKKAKMFLFDDNDTNTNTNINQNINTNIVNNNMNQNNEIKAPKSLFDGIDIPKQEKKEEKEKKKVPNFLFDEEDKKEIKEEKKEIKEEKQNIFNQNTTQNINPISSEVKKPPAKKKFSLFDILDEKPQNNAPKNVPVNNNNKPKEEMPKKEEPKKEEPKKEEPKKEEPKKEEPKKEQGSGTKKLINIFEEKPKEEVKRMTLFEPTIPKKLNENKMASRFENMLEQKKGEKNPPTANQPKKLDFASKFSNLQNALAGRMSMGGNVFTMPVGGIKAMKKADQVHDEIKQDNNDESIKTEEKEISQENKNAILEENVIQETSYENNWKKRKKILLLSRKKNQKRKNSGLGMTM